MKQSLPGKYTLGPSVAAICYVIFIHLSQLFTEAQMPAQVPAQIPMKNSYTALQNDIETKIPEEIKEDAKTEISFEEKYADKSFVYLLLDYRIDIKEDASCIINVHKKIKIQHQDAKDLGDRRINYVKGREQIKDIEAYTYTPDGEKHQYTKIQDRKRHEGYRLYSDSMVKIITLPEVNVGSIIEEKYTMESIGKVMPGEYWDCFPIYMNTPAKEVNYTVSFPESLGMKYKGFNVKEKPMVTKGEDGIVTYSWRKKNIYTPEENEDFLPELREDSFIDVVEFSSVDTWAEISDWYYGLMQKNIKINDNMIKAAEEIFKEKETSKDKVRAVMDYINDNFRYVSMSFGSNTVEPHRTDIVFKNKYGDCKDLSLLCKTLLGLGGVESSLALFIDENSASDPQIDLPMIEMFDHALLLIHDEEGEYYADPLISWYDLGEYPLDYQGGYTFIINDKGGRHDRFPIFDEKRKYTHKKSTIELYEDGSALIESKNLWDLDQSINTRQLIDSFDREEMKGFMEALNRAHGEVLDRNWEGLENKYGTITSYLKHKIEDKYIVAGDIIIVEIQKYGKRSEFMQEERKNPVFYSVNSLNVIEETYKVPEGYKIYHLPQDLDLDCGIFQVQRTYRAKGNEITYKETERYRRKELPKEDYPALKEFFTKLPKLTEQRILLKKMTLWEIFIKELFLPSWV